MKPTAVDMYCGCGAVTEGLKTHFRVVAAIDCDPAVSASYRTNHPKVKFFEDDITTLSPNSVLKAARNRNIDLLVVCAPCQPFSSQNNSRSKDPRVPLILQASRFAAVLKPRIILFENVSGLLAPRYASLVQTLNDDLQSLDYTISYGPIRLNAADYGVPQRRYRCVMIAAKRGIGVAQTPLPLTPDGRRITVRAAIGDLPSLVSGEADETDSLHFARKHKPIALKRFSRISKDGGSRFELPASLELKCHKGHSGHPDVYGRMSWDDVAPTLTTGCTDATRGRFIHPWDDRSITLREAARLQTFPDDYQFRGCPQSIAKQIGNAVPVEFVRVLGKSMSLCLKSAQREEQY